MDTIEQIENEVEANAEVPAGYEEFRLSTKGKKGAPVIFHARNLDYTEMFALGSITEKDMAIKLPDLLQKTILEPVNVCNLRKFKTDEFTEFLARFLATYYQSTIEIPYQITDEDKAWVLQNVYAGDDKDSRYRDWLLAIKSGRVKPTIEVDLTKLDFYNVDEAPNRVKYERTYPSGKHFELEFSLPEFGDSAILAKALEEEFAEEDKKFATTYENYQLKQEIKAKRIRGELVDTAAMPYIPETELKAVKEYELRKTARTIELTKGLYLASIDGVDVSDKKFSERVELAKDPRFDYNAMQMLMDQLKDVHIGIIPKIKCRHPVKEVKSEIDHTFRSLELFACLQQYRPDNASTSLI